jgi:hypothetical protein
MANEVQTYTDYEWNSRINSLVNKLMYNQEIDPKTTNRYELEAAKLILRWEDINYDLLG